MADLKISELTQRTPDGTEYIECIISPFTPGTNRKILISDLTAVFGGNPSRGDYNGAANAFPSSGGSGTAGAIQLGDRWRLSAQMTIGGTDIYQAGTIIEAAINTPGQTTSNWIKYAIQS